jgi:hypothetical protein
MCIVGDHKMIFPERRNECVVIRHFLQAEKKINFSYDPEAKTIYLSGGTRENPIRWSDIEELCVAHGLPIDENGTSVIPKDVTLKIRDSYGTID